MKHEDYKELIALDALDALDREDERDALATHLAECDDCRAELNALRRAAASLAYATPPVAPAPELRAQILARIKSLPQDEMKDATSLASAGNGAAAAGTS